MTYRTTQADLDRWSHRLNQVTGSPAERFKKGHGDGPDSWRLISNAGHYYICQGNGGYKLARIGNEGGGDSDVFEHGRRYTKRELVWLISAFVKGFELGRDNA